MNRFRSVKRKRRATVEIGTNNDLSRNRIDLRDLARECSIRKFLQAHHNFSFQKSLLLLLLFDEHLSKYFPPFFQSRIRNEYFQISLIYIIFRREILPPALFLHRYLCVSPLSTLLPLPSNPIYTSARIRPLIGTIYIYIYTPVERFTSFLFNELPRHTRGGKKFLDGIRRE